MLATQCIKKFVSIFFNRNVIFHTAWDQNIHIYRCTTDQITRASKHMQSLHSFRWNMYVIQRIKQAFGACKNITEKVSPLIQFCSQRKPTQKYVSVMSNLCQYTRLWTALNFPDVLFQSLASNFYLFTNKCNTPTTGLQVPSANFTKKFQIAIKNIWWKSFKLSLQNFFSSWRNYVWVKLTRIKIWGTRIKFQQGLISNQWKYMW